MTNKTCSDCGQTKKIDCFSAGRSTRRSKIYHFNFGYCKDCEREKKRDNYLKNKDRYNAMNRKRYRENIDKAREYASKYYQENKEHIKQRVKKYADANREKIRARQVKNYNKNKKTRIANAKKWREKNADKRKAIVLKHSRKMRETLGDSYIKNLILGKGGTLKHKDIPQELVELKREQIKLTRTLKQGAYNE